MKTSIICETVQINAYMALVNYRTCNYKLNVDGYIKHCVITRL